MTVRKVKFRVVGATPLGLTPLIASQIGVELVGEYKRQGREALVKLMRFIPSTKVEINGDGFEVIANTTVTICQGNKAPTRSESVESVITVSDDAGVYKLQDVKTPSFQHVS